MWHGKAPLLLVIKISTLFSGSGTFAAKAARVTASADTEAELDAQARH